MPKYAVISVGEGNSYGHPEDVINRLDYYVDLLDKDVAALIRAKYFEQYSWSEITKHFGQPKSTLSGAVSAGLESLAWIFGYTENFLDECDIIIIQKKGKMPAHREIGALAFFVPKLGGKALWQRLGKMFRCYCEDIKRRKGGLKYSFMSRNT